ncbi:MAG: hypothetical protein N2376_03100 [Clostridia bacterium]|nr:hypothetical protein [Clostridia bacterium]
MPDDLDKKLKQIADMFGVTDTSNLKNIVENIMPSASNTFNSSPAPEAENTAPYANVPANTMNSGRGGGGMDLNFLSKANEMLSAFNSVKDSRISLLNSVQPFLGAQRQQRLNGAVQLLKIIAVISSIAPSANRNIKG